MDLTTTLALILAAVCVVAACFCLADARRSRQRNTVLEKAVRPAGYQPPAAVLRQRARDHAVRPSPPDPRAIDATLHGALLATSMANHPASQRSTSRRAGDSGRHAVVVPTQRPPADDDSPTQTIPRVIRDSYGFPAAVEPPAGDQ